MPKTKTIALDFDGVIHGYTSGWKGADVIPDPPVPGAIDFIKKALEDGFRVVIYSVRSSRDHNGIEMSEKACAAIEKYLLDNGLTNLEVAQIPIVSNKPSATVYIDDRAWPFEGTFPTLGMIDAFKPWNKR